MGNEFEKEVLTRLARIETKLEDHESIRTKAEEARAKAYDNERRIKELEDDTKWLKRTITGAIITGVVSIIVIFIKIGLGIN